jgi:hypothetical protein
MIKKNTLLILLQIAVTCAYTQQLTGVWSGKISRAGVGYGGVENLEVQIYQSGKNLVGYTFAFKDTNRFVMFEMSGYRNRKTKEIQISEWGRNFYLLPPDFSPCQKQFSLKFHKVGRTQYLSGTWTGVGNDTSCFPGEQLLVVLQKVRRPEYPVENYVQQRLINQILRQVSKIDTSDALAEARQEEKVETILPRTKGEADSSPVERKLDIQQILQLADTTATITLYDNAIIDDDTVSIFLDKRPIFIRQRISDKPLTFTISLTELGKPTEIMMQAENLGSIPPNTAVMIVQTKQKRYEVRLNAGFEKHAVVILTYQPD